jgi:branched-chain amino acid transport system substrate-binding protein
LEAFDQVPSNKIVGGIFSNEASGNFFREVLPPYLTANGYTVEVGDTVQLGTEDYTSVISAFKKVGAELLTGNMYPPDFTNFYKQAIQQGWQPKVPFCSKATLFPQSVDALGEVGNGVMKELWWHRTFPFKSSLSGETCAELADDFEATTGKQQTSPLLHYVVGEMAIYALKNAADPKNKDAVLAAVETMKVDTIVGTIDFTGPIIEPLGPKNTDFPAGPGHKRKNVYDHGLAGAQWILVPGGKFPFTEVVTGNAAAPYLTDDLLNPIQPVPIAV